MDAFNTPQMAGVAMGSARNNLICLLALAAVQVGCPSASLPVPVDAGAAFDAGLSSECDLVAQTGCESMPGAGCYPMGAAGGRVCLTPTDALGVNAICDHADCVGGTNCYGWICGGGRPSNNRCLRFCRLDQGTAGCPASGGQPCHDEPSLQLPNNVGICPPPC